MPEIVIFREKHGSRYFDLDSNGGWSRICMALFRERDAQGWYGCKEDGEPDLPTKPTPPEDMEDLEALAGYTDLLRQYKNTLRQAADQQDERAAVCRARKGGMSAARSLIEMRCDHQYEGYVFESTEKVPEETPRWVFEPGARIAFLAGGIQILLDNKISDNRRDYAEDQLARASETDANAYTQAPTREQEGVIRVLSGHLRNLLARPGDMSLEDSARRYSTRRGLCEGLGLTLRRLNEYGTVEAVLDARMASRFLNLKTHALTSQHKNYRESLRQEILSYLDSRE